MSSNFRASSGVSYTNPGSQKASESAGVQVQRHGLQQTIQIKKPNEARVAPPNPFLHSARKQRALERNQKVDEPEFMVSKGSYTDKGSRDGVERDAMGYFCVNSPERLNASISIKVLAIVFAFIIFAAMFKRCAGSEPEERPRYFSVEEEAARRSKNIFIDENLNICERGSLECQPE